MSAPEFVPRDELLPVNFFDTDFGPEELLAGIKEARASLAFERVGTKIQELGLDSARQTCFRTLVADSDDWFTLFTEKISHNDFNTLRLTFNFPTYDSNTCTHSMKVYDYILDANLGMVGEVEGIIEIERLEDGVELAHTSTKSGPLLRYEDNRVKGRRGTAYEAEFANKAGLSRDENTMIDLWYMLSQYIPAHREDFAAEAEFEYDDSLDEAA